MDTLAKLFKPDLAGERDSEPDDDEAVLFARGLVDDVVAPVVVV